jgi:hypothetical protein
MNEPMIERVDAYFDDVVRWSEALRRDYAEAAYHSKFLQHVEIMRQDLKYILQEESGTNELDRS